MTSGLTLTCTPTRNCPKVTGNPTLSYSWPIGGLLVWISSGSRRYSMTCIAGACHWHLLMFVIFCRVSPIASAIAHLTKQRMKPAKSCHDTARPSRRSSVGQQVPGNSALPHQQTQKETQPHKHWTQMPLTDLRTSRLASALVSCLLLVRTTRTPCSQQYVPPTTTRAMIAVLHHPNWRPSCVSHSHDQQGHVISWCPAEGSPGRPRVTSPSLPPYISPADPVPSMITTGPSSSHMSSHPLSQSLL